jgi:hypothetical protein
MTTLQMIPDEPELLQAYSYSYPHKSSYRTLSPSVSIREVWKGRRCPAIVALRACAVLRNAMWLLQLVYAVSADGRCCR